MADASWDGKFYDFPSMTQKKRKREQSVHTHHQDIGIAENISKQKEYFMLENLLILVYV